HQLHMRIVRSSYAHGRILSINLEEALAMPGVVGVWTTEDVRDIPKIPFRQTKAEGLETFIQLILAREELRYVSEPIAAVFATSAYLAEDAADLVYADIEPLPPVVTALAEPGIFDPGYSTEATVIRKGYGDVEAAFRAAAHIVEVDAYVGRHSGVPLETRGAIGRYDKARDLLELHGAAKKPHWIRDRI